MKKYILKLSCLALLLLLCGCGKMSQSSFEKYTKEAFRQLISDQLTLHHLLQNPSDYEIDTEDYPAFQDLTEKGQKKSLDDKKKLLKSLDRFALESLSKEERRTALLLKNELEGSISLEENYSYIRSYLGKNGASLNLLSDLSQYRLNDAEDVNSYFTLLKAIPDYLNEILNYELRRQKAGYETSSYLLNNELTEISSFLNNPDANILITSFKERVERFDSSGAHYIEKNRSILKQTVYPAYESYVSNLRKQIKTSHTIERYCQYKDGKDYYQALISYEVGSSLSADQCKSAMENMLQQAASALEELAKVNPLIYEEYLTTELKVTDPEEIIKALKNHLLIEFPKMNETDLRISRSDYNTAAYYSAPAWDKKEDSVIHLSSLENDPAKLYGQLAHEGYPGHAYQLNYFYQTIIDPIRLLLLSKGYEEGWGSYAEIYSYDFLPLKTEEEGLQAQLQSYYRNKRLYEISLYSLCDLLVNYDNYSEDQLQGWLENYGLDHRQASLIYRESAESPCSYLLYGIGYHEIITLINEKESEEDFSMESFYRWFLDCGSAPLSLLKEDVFWKSE